MFVLNIVYFFLGIQRVLSGSSFRRSLLCFLSSFVVQFSRSVRYPLSRTALLVYHIFFLLSIPFFQKFSTFFLAWYLVFLAPLLRSFVSIAQWFLFVKCFFDFFRFSFRHYCVSQVHQTNLHLATIGFTFALLRSFYMISHTFSFVNIFFDFFSFFTICRHSTQHA